MLIEFRVGNFLSFKDEAALSMVAAKAFKEHQDTHTVEIDSGFRLLKTAVIYGNNASGKTNLLTAMLFMRRQVLSSFRESLVNENKGSFSLKKFRLDRQQLNAPTMFEVTFEISGTWYRYGFELGSDRVLREWLFQNTTKEVSLFKRTGQSFEINKSTFKEGLGKEQYTNENVLFLTLIAHMNGSVSKTVGNWFGSIGGINMLEDAGPKDQTVELLKTNPDFQKWIGRFLEFLEIASISTNENEIPFVDPQDFRSKVNDEEVIGLLGKLQDKLRANNKVEERIQIWHRQYDGKGIFVDTVPFDLEQQESAGTRKLIHLLGPLYFALQNGTLLIIDEFNLSLHNALIVKLLEYFHQENIKGAQVIFSVHDVSILDKDIFRRDQIFFVEKDQYGASSLYSLSDFKSSKVRNKSDFAKNYLEGKYGAIPYFASDSKSKSLFHGQKL